MGDADVRLTTVTKDGAKLSNLVPDGSLNKEDGKKAISGKWQMPTAGGKSDGLKIDLEVAGSSVKSVQKPFGNLPFMGEVEESEKLFAMHVTMGGFPMKAWLAKKDGKPVLAFSNGGRWSKL